MVIFSRTAVGGLATAHEAADEGFDWLRSWSFDPTALVPVALFVWWYLAGIRRWPDRTRPHAWWRTASFLAGAALLLLALESPLDALAARHLTFHMAQHEVVMLLAVPALLLGAPATPVLRGMPRWLRQRVVRPLAASRPLARAASGLGSPGGGAAALVATVWAWHLAPGWYDAALRSPALHAFQHTTFAAAAGLFWWNVVGSPPHRPRLAAMPRILYLVVVGAAKDGAAMLILLASTPLYHEYSHVEPVMSWTPLRDQQIAGLVMWAPGTLLMLGVAGAIFLRWYSAPSQTA